MLEKFTLKRDVSKSKLNSAAQVEYLISYPTVKDWKIVKHMKLNCRAQVMSKLQFDNKGLTGWMDVKGPASGQRVSE